MTSTHATLLPAGLDDLVAGYRSLSQAMRVAPSTRAFDAAWRKRTVVAAQIVALTGHPVEVYL